VSEAFVWFRAHAAVATRAFDSSELKAFFYFRSYRWDGTHKHIGMHSVSHEAMEKAFFTSPDLHQKIAKARAPLSQPADVPFEVPEDAFRNVMEHSLRDAIEATKAVNTVQWDVDSIRSIALTIFIQRAGG
jgi:hypothetical protein